MKVESASLHTVKDAEPILLSQWSTEILPSATSTLFSLTTVLAEQNLWSWSQDTSLPAPQIASFSNWSGFPFYWHLPLELLAFERWATEPRFGNTLISLWTTSGKTYRTYININRYRSFGLPIRMFLHLLPSLLSSSSGFLLLSIKQCPTVKYTIHLKLFLKY